VAANPRAYYNGAFLVGSGGPQPRREIRFVSVVLPCLNEEDGVGPSVMEAFRGLERAGLPGEVIVVDNGSTDGSVAAAERAGARVVYEHRRGTGVATFAGVEAATGDVIVTADADQTYDLENLGDLLGPLREGADLVVGSRMRGRIAGGAMPVLHRHIGTPLFNVMLRLLTGALGVRQSVRLSRVLASADRGSQSSDARVRVGNRGAAPGVAGRA
jgi:glycosyltransferase involved in cell wall biosynthesis